MESQVKEVYKNLKQKLINAYDVGEQVIAKKANLDVDIAKAYASGEVEGKNQKERYGWVANRFEDQVFELSVFEKESNLRKHELELARIDVEEMRALLRLKELV